MATRTYANTTRGRRAKRTWDSTSSDLFDDFIAKKPSGSGADAKEASRLIMYDFSCSPGKKISPSLRREEPRPSNGASKLAVSAQAKKPPTKKGGSAKGGKGKRTKPKLLAVFDFDSEEEDEEEEDDEDEELKAVQRMHSKTRPRKPPPIPPVPAITPSQSVVRSVPSPAASNSKPVSGKPLMAKWKKVPRPEKRLVVEQSPDRALLGESESPLIKTEDGKPVSVQTPPRLTIAKWKNRSPTKNQKMKGSPTVVESTAPRGRVGPNGGTSVGKRRGTAAAEGEGPSKKAKVSSESVTDLSQESQEPEIFLGPSFAPKRKADISPVPSRQMKWTLRSHIPVYEEEEEEEVVEEEEEEEEGEDEDKEEVMEEEVEEEGEMANDEKEQIKEEDKTQEEKEEEEEKGEEGKCVKEAEDMEAEPEASQQTPTSEPPKSQDFSEGSPEMSSEDPLGSSDLRMKRDEKEETAEEEKTKEEDEGKELEKAIQEETGEKEREKVEEEEEGGKAEQQSEAEGEDIREKKEDEKCCQDTEMDGDSLAAPPAEQDDPVRQDEQAEDKGSHHTGPPVEQDDQVRQGERTEDRGSSSKEVQQSHADDTEAESQPTPLESDSHDLEGEHGITDEPSLDESMQTPDLSLSEPVDNPTFGKKFERHLEGVVSYIHVKLYKWPVVHLLVREQVQPRPQISVFIWHGCQIKAGRSGDEAGRSQALSQRIS